MVMNSSLNSSLLLNNIGFRGSLSARIIIYAVKKGREAEAKQSLSFRKSWHLAPYQHWNMLYNETDHAALISVLHSRLNGSIPSLPILLVLPFNSQKRRERLTTAPGAIPVHLHFLTLTNGSITPFIPVIADFFRFLPSYFTSPCFLVRGHLLYGNLEK